MNNEPEDVLEIRREIRAVANGLVLDAVFSYAAVIRERSLTKYGDIVLDEWSSACHEIGQAARQTLDTQRDAPTTAMALLIALGTNEDAVDEAIEDEVRQRQEMLRGEATGLDGDDPEESSEEFRD